jgi:hypothetical protein
MATVPFDVRSEPFSGRATGANWIPVAELRARVRRKQIEHAEHLDTHLDTSLSKYLHAPSAAAAATTAATTATTVAPAPAFLLLLLLLNDAMTHAWVLLHADDENGKGGRRGDRPCTCALPVAAAAVDQGGHRQGVEEAASMFTAAPEEAACALFAHVSGVRAVPLRLRGACAFDVAVDRGGGGGGGGHRGGRGARVLRLLVAHAKQHALVPVNTRYARHSPRPSQQPPPQQRRRRGGGVSVHAQPPPVSEWKGVDRRLRVYGLETVDVRGDGNCQFRSLAYLLHGSSEEHARVRARAVAELAGHAKRYEGFHDTGIGGDAGYREYIERMSRRDQWGDHVTLLAAARAYEAVVYVVTDRWERPVVVNAPTHGGEERRALWLGFLPEVHYRATRSLGGGAPRAVPAPPPSKCVRFDRWEAQSGRSAPADRVRAANAAAARLFTSDGRAIDSFRPGRDSSTATRDEDVSSSSSSSSAHGIRASSSRRAAPRPFAHGLLTQIEKDYAACSQVSSMYRAKHAELIELFTGISKLLLLWQSTEGHAYNRRLQAIIDKYGELSPDHQLTDDELALMRAEQATIMSEFDRINKKLDRSVDPNSPFFSSLTPKEREAMQSDTKKRKQAVDEMFLRQGMFNRRDHETLDPSVRALYLRYGSDPGVLEGVHRVNERMNRYTYAPKLYVLTADADADVETVRQNVRRESATDVSMEGLAEPAAPAEAQEAKEEEEEEEEEDAEEHASGGARPPFNMGSARDFERNEVPDNAVAIMHDWRPIAASTYQYVVSDPEVRPTILAHLRARRFSGVTPRLRGSRVALADALALLDDGASPFAQLVRVYYESANRIRDRDDDAPYGSRCGRTVGGWARSALSTYRKVWNLVHADEALGGDDINFEVWRAFMTPQVNPWIKTAHMTAVSDMLAHHLFLEGMRTAAAAADRLGGGPSLLVADLMAALEESEHLSLRWLRTTLGWNVWGQGAWQFHEEPGQSRVVGGTAYRIATIEPSSLPHVLHGPISPNTLTELIDHLLEKQSEVCANREVGDRAYLLIHSMSGPPENVRLKRALLDAIHAVRTVYPTDAEGRPTAAAATAAPSEADATTTAADAAATAEAATAAETTTAATSAPRSAREEGHGDADSLDRIEASLDRMASVRDTGDDHVAGGGAGGGARSIHPRSARRRRRAAVTRRRVLPGGSLLLRPSSQRMRTRRRVVGGGGGGRSFRGERRRRRAGAFLSTLERGDYDYQREMAFDGMAEDAAQTTATTATTTTTSGSDDSVGSTTVEAAAASASAADSVGSGGHGGGIRVFSNADAREQPSTKALNLLFDYFHSTYDGQYRERLKDAGRIIARAECEPSAAASLSNSSTSPNAYYYVADCGRYVRQQDIARADPPLEWLRLFTADEAGVAGEAAGEAAPDASKNAPVVA